MYYLTTVNTDIIEHVQEDLIKKCRNYTKHPTYERSNSNYTITIVGTIRPVSSIRCIPLPWWFDTSFTKVMPHLKDKKGFRYNMNNKKSRPYFNNDSCLTRQLSYPNFY